MSEPSQVGQNEANAQTGIASGAFFPPVTLSVNSVRHGNCQVMPSLVQCEVMNTKQSPKGKAKKSAGGEVAPPVVQGFKYVRLVGTLLQALHEAGAERDGAGNRQLFYEQ